MCVAIPHLHFSILFIHISPATFLIFLYSLYSLPSIPCLQVTGPLLAVNAVMFSVCFLSESVVYSTHTVAWLGCCSAFCKFRQPDIYNSGVWGLAFQQFCVITLDYKTLSVLTVLYPSWMLCLCIAACVWASYLLWGHWFVGGRLYFDTGILISIKHFSFCICSLPPFILLHTYLLWTHHTLTPLIFVLCIKN